MHPISQIGNKAFLRRNTIRLLATAIAIPAYAAKQQRRAGTSGFPTETEPPAPLAASAQSEGRVHKIEIVSNLVPRPAAGTASSNALLAEDGKTLVTEDGKTIVTEDRIARTADAPLPAKVAAAVGTAAGAPEVRVVEVGTITTGIEVRGVSSSSLQQQLDRLAQIVERAHGLAEVLEAERTRRLDNRPPQEISADELPQYSLRDVRMMLLAIRIMRGRVEGSIQANAGADALAAKALREAEPSVSALQQLAIAIIGGAIATVIGGVILAHIGDGADQWIRDAQELHALVAAILQEFTQLITPGGNTF